MDDAELARLAEQADQLAKDAPDARFSASWRQIADGFRELVRLRDEFVHYLDAQRHNSRHRIDD